MVRQALQALTRDCWVMSIYPKGYLVLGPRIPLISRLRPLVDEPWKVVIDEARETIADDETPEGLEIEPGAPIIERTSQLRGAVSGEVWASVESPARPKG